MGLSELVDRHRRAAAGRRIADAYRRLPQTPDELRDVDDTTSRMLDEEPW